MAARIALVAMIFFAMSASQAAAAVPLVAIDDVTPPLTKVDGGWTTSLGFTSLTDEAVALKAESVGDAPCALRLGDRAVPPTTSLLPAMHTSVPLTAAGSCVASGEYLRLFVTVGAGAAAQRIAVAAAATDRGNPNVDWSSLRFFAFALVALSLMGLVLWGVRIGPSGRRDRFFEPMPHINDTWNFKESVASNVTIGGSLVMAVFGSSAAVRAVAGDNADAVIALATIGAAIAVGFVGAGSVVALATRTRSGEFTIGGVLTASVITLTGAVGEMSIVAATGMGETAGAQKYLLGVVAAAALLVLVVYAARSLWTMLDMGTTGPQQSGRPRAAMI